MDGDRFEAFFRVLGHGAPRRGLLAALLLILLGVAPAPAQTPVAAGATTMAQAEILFVQLAQGGTFTPDAADPTRATLTLAGLWPETLYFAERPQRDAGTLATAAFLRVADLFDPADPPNAAVVLSEPARADRDVVIVALRDPVYDPAAGTLRYTVTVLDDVPDGLAPWAAQADAALPERFSGVAIFIDNTCSNVLPPKA